MSAFLLIAIAIGVWVGVVGLYKIEAHLDALLKEGLTVRSTDEPDAGPPPTTEPS